MTLSDKKIFKSVADVLHSLERDLLEAVHTEKRVIMTCEDVWAQLQNQAKRIKAVYDRLVIEEMRSHVDELQD